MTRSVGRYRLLEEIASGGMATIHLGKLASEGGFSRIVAIKQLLAHYARDHEFRSMFLDEARLVARIRHTNVVGTLDVLEDSGELFLVMEYVHGLSLGAIMRHVAEHGDALPPPVASAIVGDALEGLHAAHEARSETGEPLGIVHRDVSPQNIMVGADGVARVVDFGIAYAADRLHHTVPGQIKGKAAYMSPEQAQGEEVDRRTDVYAASVVLFEALTATRLFRADSVAAMLLKQITSTPAAPSTVRDGIPAALDEVVRTGLAKKADARYPTARAMASALEAACRRATPAEVAAWLDAHEHPFFVQRDALLERVARAPSARVDSDSTGPPVERTSLVPTRPEARPARRVWVFGAWMGAALTFGSGFYYVGTHGARAPIPPATLPQSAAQPTSPAAALPLARPESAAPAASVLGNAGAPAPEQLTVLANRPRAQARRLATSAAPSVSASPPSPPCCVDGLQIRYHDCVDNCAR